MGKMQQSTKVGTQEKGFYGYRNTRNCISIFTEIHKAYSIAIGVSSVQKQNSSSAGSLQWILAVLVVIRKVHFSQDFWYDTNLLYDDSCGIS